MEEPRRRDVDILVVVVVVVVVVVGGVQVEQRSGVVVRGRVTTHQCVSTDLTNARQLAGLSLEYPTGSTGERIPISHTQGEEAHGGSGIKTRKNMAQCSNMIIMQDYTRTLYQ